MIRIYSNNVWKILACPSCKGVLKETKAGVKCDNCKVEYDFAESGALDMRPKKEDIVALKFSIGSKKEYGHKAKIEPLIMNPNTEMDLHKVNIPFHLTRELISYFPKPEGQDSMVLDLGCGSGIHREVCMYAGFKYIGLDYNSLNATILGDAHSLPFSDNSFEFVLYVAVLEHIRYPFIMIQEVYRVLKPKGEFIGTVSFLEPWHGNSFYHHTHLGLLNSLEYGGFEVEKIAPNERWSGWGAYSAEFGHLFRWKAATCSD